MTTSATQERELERIDIKQVARRLDLQVCKKSGKAFTWCPHCEPPYERDTSKKPHHCKLGGDEQHLYHCYKCKESGDVVGLVKEVHGQDAADAYQWLGDENFLPNDVSSQREPLPPLERFARKRRISPDTMDAFGAKAVKDDPETVAIPSLDAEGNIIGWRHRMADNKQFPWGDGGKTRCGSTPDRIRGGLNDDQRQGLFYPRPFPDSGRVLVCEGEMDALAAYDAGAETVVGLPGESFSPDVERDLQDLCGGRDVVMFPDPGVGTWPDAGRALHDAGCNVQYVPPVGERDLDKALKHGYKLGDLLDRARQWQDSEADNPEDLTIQEKLVRLMEDVELVTTPEGQAWGVTGEGRARQLDRQGDFSSWLSDRYLDRHGKPPRSGDLSDVIRAFIGRARSRGETRPVYTRVARHGGCIYVDLGKEDNRAVEISPSGWQLVDRPPVVFRTSSALAPMPEPDPDAGAEDLEALGDILEVSDEDAYLTAAWMLGALQPGTPYPILLMTGPAGAGKSTSTKIVRYLVDPAGPDGTLVTGRARDPGDLFAAANGSHVLALDNITSVSQWLSDMLAGIATGTAQATRRLYTDNDLAIVQVRKPIVLNGITVDGLGNDFMDRAISISLEAPEQTKPESEIWGTVRDAAPRILGGLFEAASAALRNEHETSIDPEKRPRMADFARWICAAEDVLHQVGDWAGLDFLELYADNRAKATENVLESDPVGEALLELTSEGNAVKCTTSELLEKLEKSLRQQKGEKADSILRGSRWPGSASSLGKRLTRLKPALQNAGYRVTKESTRSGTKWWVNPGCPF